VQAHTHTQRAIASHRPNCALLTGKGNDQAGGSLASPDVRFDAVHERGALGRVRLAAII
jgi:hypothetical protein